MTLESVDALCQGATRNLLCGAVIRDVVHVRTTIAATVNGNQITGTLTSYENVFASATGTLVAPLTEEFAFSVSR